MKIIKFPGLRNVKKIEMGTKYRKLVPEKYLNYWLYQIPPKKMIDKYNETKRVTQKRKTLAAALTNARDENGKFKIGTLIRKEFDDGIEYEGVVTEYFPEEGLYKIEYDDDDTEDFDEEQMQEYFCVKQKRTKKKKK